MYEQIADISQTGLVPQNGSSEVIIYMPPPLNTVTPRDPETMKWVKTMDGFIYLFIF